MTSPSPDQEPAHQHRASAEELTLIVLMCGLSFSGKSTLARALASPLSANVVSLDDINAERGLYGGQGISGEEWLKTHRLAEERVRDYIASGQTVIVDDTGSPRFIRDKWRDIAHSARARFRIVWVDVDEDLQAARLQANRRNPGRQDVTDEVMAEHRLMFEPPLNEDKIRVDSRLGTSRDVIDSVLSALLSP